MSSINADPISGNEADAYPFSLMIFIAFLTDSLTEYSVATQNRLIQAT
jgi:hypothetical protein